MFLTFRQAGNESAFVAGLIVSQMPTLFNTPVIYVPPDRLRKRFSGRRPSSYPPRIPGPGGLRGG